MSLLVGADTCSEFCLEPLVVASAVCRAVLALHTVSDANVEPTWAFLEPKAPSTDGEHEAAEFLV